MKPKEIIQHELIGLEIEIVDASNKSLIGKKGNIIDETKNTLTIKDGEKYKKVLKSQITFRTTIAGKKIEVDGRKLVGRPEERLKKW
ncbi:MAG: ribonuclease P protein component 1 [Nanoarchaeota archaeon]|nr:ribonuclease P protein component 1 [Nanoarchaeota archaeon]